MTYNTPHTDYVVPIDGKDYLTRTWYLDSQQGTSESRHRQYYAQFVTPAVEARVRVAFTKSWRRLVEAYVTGDVYLNTCTSSDQWDRLETHTRLLVGRKVTACAYANPEPRVVFWSLSENTCICKEAARIMIEREVGNKPAKNL